MRRALTSGIQVDPGSRGAPLAQVSRVMSASPFVRTGVPRDRSSDSPLALDVDGRTSSHDLAVGAGFGAWSARIPQSWLGMSGYLMAGVALGLVLIVALTLTRGDASSTAAASAGVVTDNVVHLHAKQIGESCWRGADRSEPARVTVSLEIGLDGKVRNAVAAGETAPMRGCVEAHVKAWEFLPQAASSQMVLPFEIAPR
jgi:hypothetical protein